MNIAFHFDIDTISDQYKVPYFLPILEKTFRTLLDSDFNPIHIKIFTGDLLVWDYLPYLKDNNAVKNFLNKLLGANLPVWHDVDQSFYKSIFSKLIAVVALENLTPKVRDTLIKDLKKEKSYLGAIQVYGANKIHWDLYNQSLIPGYRYIDKELRIFYSTLDDDVKDVGLEMHWKKLPFKSVCWEDLGARHSFFDAYTSFEHAKRLATFNDMLQGQLLLTVDEILLRIGDLNAELQNELYSTLTKFGVAQTAADRAQAALSCRRFIEFLGNTLYATIDDARPLVDSAGKPYKSNPYREKYSRYIETKLRDRESEKELVLTDLQDLKQRLRDLSNLANTGVHDKINHEKLKRLLIAMITFTYDVLTLAPPPLHLPIEPHEAEF